MHPSLAHSEAAPQAAVVQTDPSNLADDGRAQGGEHATTRETGAATYTPQYLSLTKTLALNDAAVSKAWCSQPVS